jgi:hypothetical protein
MPEAGSLQRARYEREGSAFGRSRSSRKSRY